MLKIQQYQNKKYLQFTCGPSAQATLDNAIMVFSCWSFEGSGPWVLFKFINSFGMDCWLSLQLSSTTICQTNGTSSTYSLKMSFSLLFSPPFKDIYIFFPCQLIDSNSGFLSDIACRVWWRSTPQPHQKSFQHSVT